MNFNKHSNLEGRHAFLSPSKYHWLTYDEQKLCATWISNQAKEKGTRLHAFAAECIRLGERLPKEKRTLNLYVNDGIGYQMEPEQILYYSDFCFGSADTISFRRNFLRIHDLKTGETPASMNQLEIYAALFCLEYGMKPSSIKMELRIYQNNQVLVHKPEAERIYDIMQTVIESDKILAKLKESEV